MKLSWTITKELLILILTFVLAILLTKTGVFGEERQVPFQLYNSNYMIAGDKESQVKGQFSFKYALVYPFKTGIYFGYTQLMIWDLYESSSPFRDLNYNPEVFWNCPLNNIGFIDYIQLSPYEHESNGKDGLKNRSVDRFYGRLQMSAGRRYNLGFNIKGFGYYRVSKDNEDISDYTGYYEAELFFQIKNKGLYLDNEKIYVRGGSSLEKGWVEGGLKFRIVSTYIQPFFYIQIFHGYGEYMLDYNKKDTALRVGLIME